MQQWRGDLKETMKLNILIKSSQLIFYEMKSKRR